LNMSDTANPAKLASSAEFDARLKRTDEARWLASRYAPREGRQLLVAIHLLNQELQRALGAKEPMLGKIRLQWWRETMEQVAGKAPLRRHDLSEELARVTKPRPDLVAPIEALIDAYDDVLDDHLHAGGHKAGGEHEARHFAVEAALMRLAGLALDPAATPQHLEVLMKCGEAQLASTAELVGASESWKAAKTEARSIPPNLWPALAHLAATDAPGGEPPKPLSKRWRVLLAILARRL
jgi:phytoene synthase